MVGTHPDGFSGCVPAIMDDMGGLWAPFAAGLFGMCGGWWVRRMVRSGAHRRYADEVAAPTYAPWWPPVWGAGLCALSWWRLVAGNEGFTVGVTLMLPAYLWLAAVDLDVHRLPDVVTVPLFPVVTVWTAGLAWWGGDGDRWRRALLAGVLVSVFFVALHLVSRRQLGWGDVKLSGPLGMLLGWSSWTAVWVGVYAMFVCGGLAAGWLIVRRRAGRRSRIAFGPAMALGAWIGVFLT
ncbi:hypothetical protein KEM60_00884 [Austwickia sp. TVS 96-490-7B]|nr:hypothetical protein [Austwickia sp. TVS 96-490-7B]